MRKTRLRSRRRCARKTRGQIRTGAPKHELDLSKGDEKIESDDLFLSLKQLGFDKKEIEKVVAKLPADLETIEEKLEWCLSKI